MIDLSTMPQEFYELAVAAMQEIIRLRKEVECLVEESVDLQAAAGPHAGDDAAKLREEIDRLTDENDEIKKKLDYTAFSCKEHIEERDELQKEVDSLRRDLKSVTDERNGLDHVCKNLGLENDRLKQKLAESEQNADSKAPKKPYHVWTVEEEKWIASHLNSATHLEVAEKFGVSEIAAKAKMQAVKKN